MSHIIVPEIDRSASAYGAYKYQWARYVARKALKADVQLLKEEVTHLSPDKIPDIAPEAITSIPSNPTELQLRDIAREAKQLTFGKPPDKDGVFHMGIVGSGVGGMFTALLIDHLNKRSNGALQITYDILEASGEKRLGGRLYTHRFEGTPEQHQYYDVGAMRFPKNAVMDRTFRLFDWLGIKEGGTQVPRLVRYYMYDDDKVCPKYFNDVRIFGDVKFDTDDPFSVNKWLPKDDPNRIPSDLTNQDPNILIDNAIAKIKKGLQEDLDEAAKRGKDRTDPMIDGKADPGWEALMEIDYMSTRQFFRADKNTPIGKTPFSGCGYNFNTIEWLETYAYATGWYNQSLAETVLESLDFDPPSGKVGSNDYWYCIEGGTQLLAKEMADRLGKKPTFNTQVTAIDTDLGTGEITLSLKTTKPDNWDPNQVFKPSREKRSYFTVFNSTTLGALQRMDLSKANLLYGTKQAIRSLNYGASCKVGIQFKEMWWMQSPWNIKHGGVAKTDLPLRVCVYPSYNVHDPVDQQGVLLCSYSWAQDAQRIGTLIDPRSPQNEEELKDLMLSNLAQLHAKPDQGWDYDRLLDHLHGLYKTHHAFDWYHDPNMSGGFGYFGPGQFSGMWPEIIKPNGWLFLIGEAASAHHAWIVGALESSVRAVYQLMHMLDEQSRKAGRTFDGYADAMKYLAGPDDGNSPDWKLPFVGLPREIPVRQSGTGKDQPVQENPQKPDVDLSFVAAQVITSFYQLLVEVAKEEELKQTGQTATA